jgi:hypothetical protein
MLEGDTEMEMPDRHRERDQQNRYGRERQHLADRDLPPPQRGDHDGGGAKEGKTVFLGDAEDAIQLFPGILALVLADVQFIGGEQWATEQVPVGVRLCNQEALLEPHLESIEAPLPVEWHRECHCPVGADDVVKPWHTGPLRGGKCGR